MRRAVRQISLAAPILELIAETVRCERLAVFSNQQRHVADLRRVNARLEVGVQRDIAVDRVTMLVLCLPKLHSASANVLPAQARRVLAASRGVPQHVKREAGLSTNRMLLVEL